MNKTKIIREIIGTKIEPYGFRYVKTDGPCRIFMREVTGIKRYYDPDIQTVKQYINIQEHRYSPSLVVRFYTDAYGHNMDVELQQSKKYSNTGWLDYTDENSYREQLKRIVVLIIKYGFDLLDQISIESEIIPTKAMTEKLSGQYKQLDREFIEEYHVKKTPEQAEDIDAWFSLIERLIRDNAELPYEEVKEMLVKVAAFIGERDCELCQKKWDFKGKYPGVIPVSSFAIHYMAYSPLSVVVDLWKSRYEDQDMAEIFNSEIRDHMKQVFLINKNPEKFG